MFRRAAAVSLALIIASFICVYSLWVTVRSSDDSIYQKLLAESAAIHSKSRVKTQPIEPLRKNVRKDIWMTRDPYPWHASIQSETSALFLFLSKDGMTLREETEKCEGWIFDQNTSYYIRADRSRYENGELWLNGQVHVIHPGGEARAEKAHLTEQLCCFEDEVQLKDHAIFKRESFALADRVLYHPEEETFFLTSHSPKRVLFSQEGVSLSAPEVRIKRESGFVEGIGDVHFTFDGEEKEAIHEMMRKFP